MKTKLLAKALIFPALMLVIEFMMGYGMQLRAF